MSGIVGKNAGRASGIVGAGDIGTDAVSGANIADDAIDSEHYADGSIDNAHIADDAIDSEHYAAASIDTAHIATNQIDETLMKDAFVGDFTEVTIASGDSLLLGDVTDSGNTKRDTVQGLLDLVSGGTNGWVYLTETTASTAADVEFLSLATSTYKVFKVVCYDVWCSGGNGRLAVEIREDGTPSYPGSGYYNDCVGRANNDTDDTILTADVANGATWLMTFDSMSSNTAQRTNGEFNIFDLGDTSVRIGMTGFFAGTDGGGQSYMNTVGGTQQTADADGYDGIKITNANGSGTLNGVFMLYGLTSS